MSEPQEVLSAIGSETLEQLAFLFSVSEEVDRTIAAEGATGCRIPFSGAGFGELVLLISSAVLPELAANMLGEEDGCDLDTEQMQDALRETGNVMCGNILPSIYGKDAVFDLASPEILSEGEIRRLMEVFQTVEGVHRSALLSLDEGECQLFLKGTLH